MPRSSSIDYESYSVYHDITSIALASACGLLLNHYASQKLPKTLLILSSVVSGVVFHFFDYASGRVYYDFDSDWKDKIVLHLMGVFLAVGWSIMTYKGVEAAVVISKVGLMKYRSGLFREILPQFIRVDRYFYVKNIIVIIASKIFCEVVVFPRFYGLTEKEVLSAFKWHYPNYFVQKQFEHQRGSLKIRYWVLKEILKRDYSEIVKTIAIQKFDGRIPRNVLERILESDECDAIKALAVTKCNGNIYPLMNRIEPLVWRVISRGRSKEPIFSLLKKLKPNFNVEITQPLPVDYLMRKSSDLMSKKLEFASKIPDLADDLFTLIHPFLLIEDLFTQLFVSRRWNYIATGTIQRRAAIHLQPA
ncbi:MAG: hypothetical protein K1060chlam2_00179 [Chlamydiae bacterium]|nr:hypothetical protein [Chlamydiota bacterium]